MVTEFKNRRIFFHYLTGPFHLSNRTLLKKFILEIFQNEKKRPKKVNFIFCDNHYILELNRKFLAHDFYTDILTFPISADKDGIEADIYINIAQVRENAVKYGSSFRTELQRVIFHGILHLCGYDDKTKSQINKIRSLEDYYLSRYHRRCST